MTGATLIRESTPVEPARGRLEAANSAVHKQVAAPSIAELLAQNPLFQRMAGVVQQHEFGGVVHFHVHMGEIAEFVVVGDHRDRTLLRLQHVDAHLGAVGQQRAVPAARAEGGNRA